MGVAGAASGCAWGKWEEGRAWAMGGWAVDGLGRVRVEEKLSRLFGLPWRGWEERERCRESPAPPAPAPVPVVGNGWGCWDGACEGSTPRAVVSCMLSGRLRRGGGGTGGGVEGWWCTEWERRGRGEGRAALVPVPVPAPAPVAGLLMVVLCIVVEFMALGRGVVMVVELIAGGEVGLGREYAFCGVEGLRSGWVGGAWRGKALGEVEEGEPARPLPGSRSRPHRSTRCVPPGGAEEESESEESFVVGSSCTSAPKWE